jgi:nucleoside-diphosphate-sugar epimerase
LRGTTDAKQPYDVIVFGGNGFVGSNTCKALVNMGKRVAAVNRSGAPSISEPWVSQVGSSNYQTLDPTARQLIPCPLLVFVCRTLPTTGESRSPV